MRGSMLWRAISSCFAASARSRGLVAVSTIFVLAGSAGADCDDRRPRLEIGGLCEHGVGPRSDRGKAERAVGIRRRRRDRSPVGRLQVELRARYRSAQRILDGAGDTHLLGLRHRGNIENGHRQDSDERGGCDFSDR